MPLIVIGTIIVVCLFLSYFGIPWIRKSYSSNAKIIMKDIWGGENRGAFVGNRFFLPTVPSCRVTFEFENRDTVTLVIPRKTYNALSIGSTGVLEYAGKRFKKFTVNEAMDNHEKT